MKSFHSIKRHIFLVLVLTLSFACEEATDWDYETGENGKLVVEAIITNELKKHEIFLGETDHHTLVGAVRHKSIFEFTVIFFDVHHHHVAPLNIWCHLLLSTILVRPFHLKTSELAGCRFFAQFLLLGGLNFLRCIKLITQKVVTGSRVKYTTSTEICLNFLNI